MLDRPTDASAHLPIFRRLDQVAGWLLLGLLASGALGFFAWRESQRAALAAVNARQAAERQAKLGAAKAQAQRSLEELDAFLRQRREDALCQLARLHGLARERLGRPPRDWGELKASPAPAATGPQLSEDRFGVAFGLDTARLSEEDRTKVPLAWEMKADRKGHLWGIAADGKTFLSLPARQASRPTEGADHARPAQR